MNIDITKIVVALIGLLSAVITGFLIPWLKSKIGINNGQITENQRALIELAINTAVTAAEQLYNSDQGQEKKAYVIRILQEQGLYVSTEAFDAAIEAAVLELHTALKPRE